MSEIENRSSAGCKPPPNFTFKNEEWAAWRRRYERYRRVSNLGKCPESEQVDHLIYSMGDMAEDILDSFQLSSEEIKKFDVVMSKFENYYVAKRNVIYERSIFNTRKQREGEDVESFVTDLYTLSKYCDYGTLRDELIRDRIVVGLLDADVAQELQMDPGLTVETAQNKAKLAERVKRQQIVVRGESQAQVQAIRAKYDKGVNAVDKGNKGYVNPKSNNREKYEEGQKAKQKFCIRCGYTPNHPFPNCPAKEMTCFKCQRKGHFKTQCRSQTVNVVEEASEVSEEEAEYFMGAVEGSRQQQAWYVDIQTGGRHIKFKIDTGADVSLIDCKTFKEIPNATLQSTNQKLLGPVRSPIVVEGKFTTQLKWRESVTTQEIFVTKEKSEPLLGRPAIMALGLLKSICRVESSEIEREFTQLFKGIGQVNEPYHIQLKEDVKPYAISAPRRIAIPLRAKVKEELDQMVKDKVIAPVLEPTDWCAGMVPVLKKDGRVRICVDLQELNSNIKRERYVMPKVDQSLALIGNTARVFSKIDANCGFWQIPLTPESAKLTTFITPFGRFYFQKLPFGITSAPEHFERRVRELIQGLDGVVSQLDDILIFGDDREQHDLRLREVLGRLKVAGFTLNKAKCRFGVPSVTFLGHIVSDQGIAADPEKIQAINKYRQPSNKTELRSFLGMVMQLLKFLPNIAEISRPLRGLLSNKNEWVWNSNQEQAFIKMKQLLTTTPVLSKYEPNLPTKVTSDASSYGMGAVLEQKQREGGWRPVAYASRCLSETEKRYAQVEKEALAVAWAAEKFSEYLIGIKYTVVTDHKPLLTILGRKSLEGLTARLQRLKMKLMLFDFDIQYCPGKELSTADALSRAPVETSERGDVLREEELEAFIRQVIAELPCSPNRVEYILEEQKREAAYEKVANYIINGWPRDAGEDHQTVQLYKHRSDLTISQGLVLFKDRLYIPKQIRNQMMGLLHEGHLGIEKCRRRARMSIWWPSMNEDLASCIAKCRQCIETKKNRVEPFFLSPVPKDPWIQVGGDIFTIQGSNYLLVEDYFSNYPEVCELKSLSAAQIINTLKPIFARFGIPETFRADSGTQFDSREFREFAHKYGFRVILSSPMFHRSNGLAESGVKMVKKILKTSEDWNLGLLAYRSSPLESGWSPAELLMGRKLRTTVPGIRDIYTPNWKNISQTQEHKESLKQRQVRNFNSRHRTKPLTPLTPGKRVWITDMERYGEIRGTTKEPRSYLIKTDKRELRRNRESLIPCQADTENDKSQERNDSVGQLENTDSLVEQSGSMGSSGMDQSETNNTRDQGATPVRTKHGRTIKIPKRLDL